MDFENEFEYQDLDANFDEAFDEAFIEILRQMQEDDLKAGIIHIPNPKRMKEMNDAFVKISSIADKYNIKIKIEHGIESLAHAGFIRLKCPYGFVTTDVPELCDALTTASNTEFVIENDVVQIGIVFYGVFESRRMS